MNPVSHRRLGRTTLDRQLLIRRAGLEPLEAVRHLVGLQAQAADSPYLSLWSRVADFEIDALSALLYDRSVVRSSVLRGTQHIVAADDFLWLRPLIQRGRRGDAVRLTKGIDVAELIAETRRLLAAGTLTRPRLGRALAKRWPEYEPDMLGFSAQFVVPVVHAPPSGTWRKGGATPFDLAEEWIGRPLASDPSPDPLVLRYLRAFGPASVKDMQIWSGLPGLAEVVERLDLRTYQGESGVELFDLPDAELADPETPAPPRFLPDFDNLIVAYADRNRLMTDAVRRQVCVGSLVRATLVVDGTVRGMWRLVRDKDNRDAAALSVELFEPLSPEDQDAVIEEGARLLAFAEDGKKHDIRFVTLS